MSPKVKIVYFSSVTENTKRFVEKLGFEGSERIPLRKSDGFLNVTEPYVLIVPSYGGGKETKAVMPQIKKFLNDESNRVLCRGVISAGNINFGDDYLIAGRIIQKKLNVPKLYGFELLGTPEDVDNVRNGLIRFFASLDD